MLFDIIINEEEENYYNRLHNIIHKNIPYTYTLPESIMTF